MGIDLQTPDGNRSLLVLRQMISQDQYGGTWGYYINAMDANKSAYKEAKNDYIFALSHFHPNMEQIASYNQKEIARSNTSWAAHSQKMAANQAAFNARNQAWMESSNAISDMSMKGWRDRNAIQGRGQEATIDGIHDKKNVYDGSGNSMKVEAGSNRYFSNGNNEYIRTDNYLYDPNTDNTMNQYQRKEWK